MLVHRISAVARRYLPEWFIAPVRSFLTATMTPFMWSYRTGHFKSSIRNRSVDRRGNPTAWYTYSAIDLLVVRISPDGGFWSSELDNQRFGGREELNSYWLLKITKTGFNSSSPSLQLTSNWNSSTVKCRTLNLGSILSWSMGCIARRALSSVPN